MTDLADRMREHLRERMDSILECPPMWGSDGEVEAMMLTSLEMLHVVERPDDERHRFVLDAYIAYAHRKFPRSGNRRLSDHLRVIGRLAELPALLAEFRAEAEALLRA